MNPNNQHNADILDLESILLGDTGPYASNLIPLYHLPPHPAYHTAPPLYQHQVPAPPPLSPHRTSPPSLLATPSPPSLASSPPQANTTPPEHEPKREGEASALLKNKKRRKKEETGEEIFSEGFVWSDPTQPEFSNKFPVVDRISMQLSSEINNLVIRRFEASSQFSPSDNAWICYRQNQFKIACHYPKLADVTNLAIIDNNELIPIVQLFAKLCAIKENIGRTPLNQVAYVGIQHVGKKRTKRDKSELSPVPFVAVIAQASNQKCYPVLSKVSPRLIVRAQNPGFYEETTPSPPDNVYSAVNENMVDTKDHALPSSVNIPQEKMLVPQPPEVFVKREDVTVFSGKVGINTSFPTEALTVDGNILVTGNYLKPSDKRIKSEVESVSTSSQLETIRQLKLYDYNVSSRRERGVFAQELLEVMPSAVYRAGNMMYDGTVIPDFLVVNERALLYENIGATKQLDINLEKEKEVVEQMGATVLELKEHDKQTDKKLSALQRAIGFLVQEEPKKRAVEKDADDEFELWMALRFLREDQLPTKRRIIAQFILFCFGLLLCFILRIVRDKHREQKKYHKQRILQMKALHPSTLSFSRGPSPSGSPSIPSPSLPQRV